MSPFPYALNPMVLLEICVRRRLPISSTASLWSCWRMSICFKDRLPASTASKIGYHQLYLQRSATNKSTTASKTQSGWCQKSVVHTDLQAGHWKHVKKGRFALIVMLSNSKEGKDINFMQVHSQNAHCAFVLSHILRTACKMSNFIKLDVTPLRNGQLFHSFFIISRTKCLFKICLTELLSDSYLLLKASTISVNFFLTHAVSPNQYLRILTHFAWSGWLQVQFTQWWQKCHQ